MADALRWYAALLILGACGAPFAAALLGDLPSSGRGYARPVGLLLVTLLTWITASITPIGYGTPLVLTATAGVGIAGLLWAVRTARRRPSVIAWRAYLRGDWGQVLGAEIVTAVVFVIVVLLRAQTPAAAGTEKPMDMMLLQSVHRAHHFPPEDAWFAGAPVSYYYLGHVAVDVTSRVAHVTPGRAFTLGLAAAAAMAAGAIYTLAGDITALDGATTRRREGRAVAGVAGVGALLLLSTAEAPLEWFAAHDIGRAWWAWLGVEGLPGVLGTDRGVPQQFWWWWHATRVIPGTITEFPAFSFLLGDLHAHVLALPLALTACALAVQSFSGRRASTWRVWTTHRVALVVASALYAGLLMTNSWDVLLFGTVWLVAGTVARYAVERRWGAALYQAIRHLLPAASLALLLAVPYVHAYTAPELRLRWLTAGATDPARGGLVWLPLIAIVAGSVLAAPMRTRRGDVRRAGRVIAWISGIAVLAILLGTGVDAISGRGSGWITIGALCAAIAMASGASATAMRDGARGRAAWLGLIACAASVVLLTEVLNVQDALHGRWNTVFKFWYGAWTLTAAAAGASVGEAWHATRTADGHGDPLGESRTRPPRVGLRATRYVRVTLAVTCAIVVASALWYAPAMAASRSREGQPRGIDALAFLPREQPGLAAVVAWAHTLPPGSRLLELPANAYSDGDLVSAYSGVPTLVGWVGHETQWRGRNNALEERLQIADTMFTDGAVASTVADAHAYGVSYVVIGPAERRRYGDALWDRFAAWPLAFEAPGWRVFTVPAEGAR